MGSKEVIPPLPEGFTPKQAIPPLPEGFTPKGLPPLPPGFKPREMLSPGTGPLGPASDPFGISQPALSPEKPPPPAPSLNIMGVKGHKGSVLDFGKEVLKGIPTGLVNLVLATPRTGLMSPATGASYYAMRASEMLANKIAGVQTPDRDWKNDPLVLMDVAESGLKAGIEKMFPSKGPKVEVPIFGEKVEFGGQFIGEMASMVLAPEAGIAKAPGMVVPILGRAGRLGAKLEKVLDPRKMAGRFFEGGSVAGMFHVVNGVPRVIASNTYDELRKRGAEFTAGMPVAIATGALVHGAREAVRAAGAPVKEHIRQTKEQTIIDADPLNLKETLSPAQPREKIIATERAENTVMSDAAKAHLKAAQSAEQWGAARAETIRAIEAIRGSIASVEPSREPGTPKLKREIIDGIKSSMRAILVAKEGESLRLLEPSPEQHGDWLRKIDKQVDHWFVELWNKPGEWDRFQTDVLAKIDENLSKAHTEASQHEAVARARIEGMVNRADNAGVRLGELYLWRAREHEPDLEGKSPKVVVDDKGKVKLEYPRPDELTHLAEMKLAHDAEQWINLQAASRLAEMGRLAPADVKQIMADPDKGGFISGRFVKEVQPSPEGLRGVMEGMQQQIGAKPAMSEAQVPEAIKAGVQKVEAEFVVEPPQKRTLGKVLKDTQEWSSRTWAAFRRHLNPRVMYDREIDPSQMTTRTIESTFNFLHSMRNIEIPLMANRIRELVPASMRKAITLNVEAKHMGRDVMSDDLLAIKEGMLSKAQVELEGIRAKMAEGDNSGLPRMKELEKVEELLRGEISMHEWASFIRGTFSDTAMPKEALEFLQEVRGGFNGMLEEGVKAGVIAPQALLENYVNRVVTNPDHAGGVIRMLERQGLLNPTNGHSVERTIPHVIKAALNYAKSEGLPHHKVVKTIDMAELLSIYANTLSEGIAHGKMIQSLMSEGVAGPMFKTTMKEQIPNGMMSLAEVFKGGMMPVFEGKHEGKVKRQIVDERLGHLLKNYVRMQRGWSGFGANFTALNAWSKAWMLSFDSYHLGQMARVAATNMIFDHRSAWDVLSNIHNPDHPLAKAWQEAGLTYETDYSQTAAERHKRETGKALDEHTGPERILPIRMFNQFMWGRYVPAMKYASANAVFERMRPAYEAKHGAGKNPELLPQIHAELRREISRAVNEQFGGQNWTSHMRNPILGRVLRLFLLAPEWYETQFKVARGAVADIPLEKLGVSPKVRRMLGLPERGAYTAVQRDMLMKYAAQGIIGSVFGNIATMGVLTALGNKEEIEKYRAYIMKHPLKAATGIVLPFYNKDGKPVVLGTLSRLDFLLQGGQAVWSTLPGHGGAAADRWIASHGSPTAGALQALRGMNYMKKRTDLSPSIQTWLEVAPFLQLPPQVGPAVSAVTEFLPNPMMVGTIASVMTARDKPREAVKQIGRMTAFHIGSDFPMDYVAELETLQSDWEGLQRMARNPVYGKINEKSDVVRAFKKREFDWLARAQKEDDWPSLQKQYNKFRQSWKGEHLWMSED